MPAQVVLGYKLIRYADCPDFSSFPTFLKCLVNLETTLRSRHGEKRLVDPSQRTGIAVVLLTHLVAIARYDRKAQTRN